MTATDFSCRRMGGMHAGYAGYAGYASQPERFLDLTVKCIFDKNDISVRFAEELKRIDRVV